MAQLCEAKLKPQWKGKNRLPKVILLCPGLCCGLHTCVCREAVLKIISGACSLL